MILQVVVIYAMTQSKLRKLAGVLFYLLVLFLTSVADMAMFLEVGSWPEWYRKYYFINNTLRHFSAFGAVFSLIYVASTERPRGSAFRLKVVAGAMLGVLCIFVFTPGETTALYMHQVGRNLSFVSVILSAILWLSLMRSGTPDRLLLLVSGGLGLNMAGEAAAQSLIRLSGSYPTLNSLGSLVSVLSHLACLYIWWTALRRVSPQRVPSGARGPG